jgi:hypothetical protein
MASFRFRVSARDLSLRRVDAADEDDFKTWAHVVVSSSAGPATALWYSEAGDASQANFGKTSVSTAALHRQCTTGDW